ncbi:MAG: hypothetical protein HYT11_03300 [Candidatus Levybacteria bacterium]|nr:hypothetical protein [Candidatus Levybacteria bacterium]
MLKESEVQLRDMGEELLADIVGLVRETLAIKKKNVDDLPFPKTARQKKSVSNIQQPQRKTPKLQ